MKNIKIAKQLIKIAKSLIAKVQKFKNYEIISEDDGEYCVGTDYYLPQVNIKNNNYNNPYFVILLDWKKDWMENLTEGERDTIANNLQKLNKNIVTVSIYTADQYAQIHIINLDNVLSDQRVMKNLYGLFDKEEVDAISINWKILKEFLQAKANNKLE